MSTKRIKRKALSMAKRKAGGFRKARKKSWEDATVDDLKSDPHCKEEVWVAPSAMAVPSFAIEGEIDPTEEHIRIVSKALNIPASSVDPAMAASICAAAASLNDFGVMAARAGKKLMAEVAEAMHAAVNQFGTSIAKMEEQRRAREEEDDDDGTAEFNDGDELMEFFREGRHV